MLVQIILQTQYTYKYMNFNHKFIGKKVFNFLSLLKFKPFNLYSYG